MSAPRAYSSTVSSRAHLVVGLVIASIVAIVIAALGTPLVALGAAIVCIATAVFVSTVRVVIGNGRVVLGQGPLAWPSRTIPVHDVVSTTIEDLTWPQVFGTGAGFRWRATRLTVRPGPTLGLTLGSGERILVSTVRPEQAAAILATPVDAPTPNTPEDDMSESLHDRRPWFGPKRTGYGIRPQTWQGYAILLSGCVVLVLVVSLLRH